MTQTSINAKFLKVLKKSLEINHQKKEKVNFVLGKLDKHPHLSECYCVEDFIVCITPILSKALTEVVAQQIVSDMVDIINISDSLDSIILSSDFF